MPGYRASGKYKTGGDPIDTSIHHYLIGANLGLPPRQSLSVFPSVIEFSDYTIGPQHALNLSNSDFSDAEFASTRFPWMVYGAGSGHFLSTIATHGLPLHVVLAADTTVQGRTFLRQLSKCPRVVSGLEDIIKAVTSTVEFSLSGYIIHSPIRGITPSEYEHFWQFQAKIISHCQRCRGLHALIIHCNYASPPALI